MPSRVPLVYTVPEAAERLKVSPWTINKLIQRNQLGSVQIGTRRLIPADDLETFIAQRRREQGATEASDGY